MTNYIALTKLVLAVGSEFATAGWVPLKIDSAAVLCGLGPGSGVYLKVRPVA